MNWKNLEYVELVSDRSDAETAVDAIKVAGAPDFKMGVSRYQKHIGLRLDARMFSDVLLDQELTLVVDTGIPKDPLEIALHFRSLADIGNILINGLKTESDPLIREDLDDRQFAFPIERGHQIKILPCLRSPASSDVDSIFRVHLVGEGALVLLELIVHFGDDCRVNLHIVQFSTLRYK